MKVGIIGAGKVGCSIGKYLVSQGITVTGYSSKTQESVEVAATFTNTKAYDTDKSLAEESDLIFIATPDDRIVDVWKELTNYSIQGKVLCHFSGSLSSVVFSNREDKGVYACSLHPMYAFSDKFTSYKKLNQVMFTAEGDEEALSVVCSVFRGFGNDVAIISSDKKVRYHAAASMISNMMIGLYEKSLQMFLDCGFEREKARKLVEPLVAGNVTKMLADDSKEALTGPIERGDKVTIERHLQQLTREEKELYQILGRELLHIAKKKNVNRSYDELDKLFFCEDRRKEERK